ncbi:hypothetical protein BY458DRAFT_497100 [Sporodiniella umbellata]|nr:hypothetical protein BY458DRAFT_497100 [Sporodiniella umbellata]
MPVAVQERHLSRKISLLSNHEHINVRPVVKGAINEAAHVLTEAYQSNKTLLWSTSHFEKSEHVLFNLFKSLIQTASLRNRNSVIQVDGCKGILVWSDQSLFCWPKMVQTSKYARLLSFCGISIKSTDKIRRQIMADFPKYLIISFMGVLFQEQGKGYGKALLDHLLEKTQLPIYVEVVNEERIVKVFESAGFVAQGEIPIIVKEKVIGLIPMVYTPIH